jgi:hypothetical protein
MARVRCSVAAPPPHQRVGPPLVCHHMIATASETPSCGADREKRRRQAALHCQADAAPAPLLQLPSESAACVLKSLHSTTTSTLV